MPRTDPDIDTVRSVVLLLASVIGLVTVLLTIVQTRVKEAATPEAKRDIYRNFLGWISTVLVVLGLPLSFFFGAMSAFYLWLAAFFLESYLFITNDKPDKLRLEIFKLVFSAQAVVFMGLMAQLDNLLALFDALTKALTEGLKAK